MENYAINVFQDVGPNGQWIIELTCPDGAGLSYSEEEYAPAYLRGATIADDLNLDLHVDQNIVPLTHAKNPRTLSLQSKNALHLGSKFVPPGAQ